MRQRFAFLQHRVETVKPKVVVRALPNEIDRLRNGLLIEVRDFAKQLGRARLRRFRVERKLGADCRGASGIEVSRALRVELRDVIERVLQPEIFDRIAKSIGLEPFRLERPGLAPPATR